MLRDFPSKPTRLGLVGLVMYLGTSWSPQIPEQVQTQYSFVYCQGHNAFCSWTNSQQNARCHYLFLKSFQRNSDDAFSVIITTTTIIRRNRIEKKKKDRLHFENQCSKPLVKTLADPSLRFPLPRLTCLVNRDQGEKERERDAVMLRNSPYCITHISR